MAMPQPILLPGTPVDGDVLRPMLDKLFGPAEAPRELASPFPLCSGMSDFFVVDSHIFEEFVHLLGVFTAANLFCEVAVPTALAMTADFVTLAVAEGFRRDLLLVHPVKLSQNPDFLMQVQSQIAE